MCVKCVAIIEPDKNVKLESRCRQALQKEVFDRKLSNEIPKYFTELKERAKPEVFLKGPPTAKEFAEGTEQILKAAGIARTRRDEEAVTSVAGVSDPGGRITA